MAAPSALLLDRARTSPLQGPLLIGVTLSVWLAGAIYCSGYERLLSGIDNWPDSLLWSAAAVLPWLALFEWSKTAAGRRAISGPARLAAALVLTAVGSLLLEAAVDAVVGQDMASLALSVMRRLPAIAACLLLILWSRSGGKIGGRDTVVDATLASLAASIDWIEAADNYVALHLAKRTIMRRMTMRDAEQTLAGSGFVRIHRRYLVNRSRIEAIREAPDLLVRLECGVELPVGRAFAGNLPHAA